MIYRAIKIYPGNTVVVITIGPKGDGTDNTVETFSNCQVQTQYEYTKIIEINSGLWVFTYDTEEIIMITTDKIENK